MLNASHQTHNAGISVINPYIVHEKSTYGPIYLLSRFMKPPKELILFPFWHSLHLNILHHVKIEPLVVATSPKT